jgi:hypothetical protein
VAAGAAATASEEEPAETEEEDEEPALASAPRVEFTSESVRSPGARKLIIAGAITTGVLGVAAAVTGILALRQQSTFERNRDDASNPDLPACRNGDRDLCISSQNQAWADAQNAASRANTLALTTDILIGGAILTGVATAVLFVVSPTRSAEHASGKARPQIALAPHLSPTTVGLHLDSRF